MSDVSDWIEDLQRKIFDDCVKQSQNSTEPINEYSSTSKKAEDVPISIILKNIHTNFAELSYFRFFFLNKSQKIDFLEDLRKALEENSRKSLNWIEFKESSTSWFDTLFKLSQDGNNNVRTNHRDVSAENLERNILHSMDEHSGTDTIDDDSNSYSINQMDNIASSYSINTSSIGFGARDSLVESSEETDHIKDGISEVDFKLRNINKENINLRDEVLQLEETNASLERDIKMITKKLEQMTDKFKNLQREHDEQKEIFIETDRREKLCKQNMRKLEKKCIILQQKVEELEINNENILSLQEEKKKITEEKSEYLKQISHYKNQYDEKVSAYEYLEGQYNELQNNNSQLEKSYEKNLQRQQEKIQELENQNLELQAKMNRSDSSSRLSVTPPPFSYLSAHIHSTPCSSNKKIRDKDSLYSELKASGFNVDDVHIQDAREKFYNDEISNIVSVVDEAIQDIAASRNEICVPNLQLVEMDIIETLKYKITTLVNFVKVCTSTKESSMSERVEDSREKPDVLPEMKKTSGLSNDRVFISDKRDKNTIGSVPSTITLTLSNNKYESTALLTEVMNSPENSEILKINEEKIILPLAEGLNRIIELKGTDNVDELESVIRPTRNPKQKSIHTIKKNTDWLNLISKASQYDLPSIISTEEYLNSQGCINAKGDGPHYNIVNMNDYNSQEFQFDDTSDKFQSAFAKYDSNKDEIINKIDMRLVTIRPTDETYSFNPVVSSSENSGLNQFKSDDLKSEALYCRTPVYNPKTLPHRKLSVYNQSFDIDSLQTPDSVQNVSGEKKRSISTPDVQESEYISFRAKPFQPLETTITKDQLLNTYRCSNKNDVYNSPLSKKNESSVLDDIDNLKKNEAIKISKPAILAPSKFKFPDSTVNQILTNDREIKNFKPTVNKEILQRNSELDVIFGDTVAQQSRILSSSSNLKNKEEKSMNNDMITIKLDTRNIGSSTLSSEFTNTSMINKFCSDDSVSNQNILDSMLISNVQINDQTYIKKGVNTEERRQHHGATVASSAMAATVGGEETSSRCISGSEEPAVERAMSSGEEDSSAESECDVRPPENEVEPIPGRRRHNNDAVQQEDKVEPLINVNGISKGNNYQKIPSNYLTQEVIKEDESPKAFPSWTDERLQESGIASFPDIDSEISENLSEDELKKKYTTFSVGLGTDRMTLSKRLILSRRHRDQAEKNFSNEFFKMQQDIKELAPLCIDSESVERVERVKQQLEMVTRCAHRISCSAETLGAVHQERRVSRAVLLADKYLQTLRTKCEKLAAELAETKRILAENNIMLEENLSEMGDDFPRVRYRGVPNNNRTMMARRRASIATISRPLMGSNQDISKELPRQRNSVSGRVPGLRRPSLCFETPKWEIEKLDRTDSSSSITELREIFEQTESRRHSQEENNNLIRTSIKNHSTNTSEYIEGEELWSNTREDIVPELSHDNEIISPELGQHYRHPLICWLLNRYMTWKPTLWCIFIAFLLGFFINRVVSSAKYDGPPMSWWSIEEILNQYIQVKNEKHPIPRPI